MTATPAKLRSGEWGAKVQGAVKEGEIVEVRAASGKAWNARITRVVWTDGTVALCATASMDRVPSASKARRGGCSCDCGDCKPRCHCESHCNCRGGNIYDC